MENNTPKPSITQKAYINGIGMGIVVTLIVAFFVKSLKN